jgi:hypothetical protein
VQAQIVGNTIDTITTVDQAVVAETLNASTTAQLEAGFLFRTNNVAARLRLSLINNSATTATPGAPAIETSRRR